YVGAAATKSIVLGVIILATASLFVPIRILHPVWMIGFLILTAATFSLFGFIIGLWAKGFEQLQFIPMLVVTPLTFLGGAFYSIDMLPPTWRTVTLFNPVVYLISGFRWSFYESSDVSVKVSLAMTLGFFLLCLAVVGWIFKTGYRLKSGNGKVSSSPAKKQSLLRRSLGYPPTRRPRTATAGSTTCAGPPRR